MPQYKTYFFYPHASNFPPDARQALSPMYKSSLASFVRLFQACLSEEKDQPGVPTPRSRRGSSTPDAALASVVGDRLARLTPALQVWNSSTQISVLRFFFFLRQAHINKGRCPLIRRAGILPCVILSEQHDKPFCHHHHRLLLYTSWRVDQGQITPLTCSHRITICSPHALLRYSPHFPLFLR